MKKDLTILSIALIIVWATIYLYFAHGELEINPFNWEDPKINSCGRAMMFSFWVALYIVRELVKPDFDVDE